MCVVVVVATKADEAARKKREKMELVKAEEAELMGTVVKKTPTQQKKGGKKKKNDVSLLLLQGEADALVKNADKKLKAEKKLAAAKEQETTRRLLDEQKKQAELIPMDPLLQNTESMLQVPAGRSINKQSMEEGAASGLDAALASMGGLNSTQTMTYKEFEERMLPIVKEDYPGLRLTQYKEKVFQMWKKSPENPSNQMP
jgi:hypothetical protein